MSGLMRGVDEISSTCYQERIFHRLPLSTFSSHSFGFPLPLMNSFGKALVVSSDFTLNIEASGWSMLSPLVLLKVAGVSNEIATIFHIDILGNSREFRVDHIR